MLAALLQTCVAAPQIQELDVLEPQILPAPALVDEVPGRQPVGIIGRPAIGIVGPAAPATTPPPEFEPTSFDAELGLAAGRLAAKGAIGLQAGLAFDQRE